jgi:hypothetical protein
MPNNKDKDVPRTYKTWGIYLCFRVFVTKPTNMMDRFFPLSDSAEDLGSAKAILIIHVVHRGYNFGTFVGLGAALVITTAKAVRGSTPLTGASSAISPFAARLLQSAARGSVFGLAFGALAVGGRMWGRELIEWQDRSWRLLNHAGQTQTDYYSAAGMLAGAAVGTLVARRIRNAQSSAGLTTNVKPLLRPRTIVLGSTAIGSAVAIVTMMGLRVLVQTERNSKFARERS